MEENFVRIASLIGDPARAAMLWNLLDGRAYTAGELALCADLTPSAASNHLTKLVNEGLLSVERQGRHKYVSFASPQIAAVIEAMGSLVPARKVADPAWKAQKEGLRYCRKCYDHLAGQVSVQLTEALLKRQLLEREENLFLVTATGIDWFATLGIDVLALNTTKRPLTRVCLDWSERKAHLAGSLGQALLSKLMELDWLRNTVGSREVVVTSLGRQQLSERLQIG